MPLEPPILPYQPRQTALDLEAQTLAANSLRTLGIFLALSGCACAAPYLLVEMTTVTAGALPIIATSSTLFFILVFLIITISGVTYWICSSKIRRANRTAAVIALVLACMHLGLIATGFFLALLALLSGKWGAFMVVAIAGLFILGLLDLIRHLRRFIRSCDGVRTSP